MEDYPLEKELLNTVKILKKLDDLVEMRIISRDKKVLKLMKSQLDSELVDLALQYNGEANIYLSLNPVKEEKKEFKAVSDVDIKRRRWILIDLDPVKSFHQSYIMGKREIEDCSKTLKEVLSEKGWGLPFEFSSGNGRHLLYPVDLPNTDEVNIVVKNFLKSLSIYFSKDYVHIDPVNYNASRLIRFYGTDNVKGDEPEKSYLLEELEEIKYITKEQLEAFVEEFPVVESDKNNSGFNLEEWLSTNKVEVSKRSRWKNRAYRYVLKECPFNSSHTNESAYIIRFDSGAIAAGCLHNSCKGKNWSDLKNIYTDKITRGDSNPSTILINISEEARFYKDDLEEGYASIKIEKHRELYKIRSQKFKKWLTFKYYKETGKAPSTEAMSQALSVIETKALFEGESVNLNRRVARNGENFYYDMGDKEWSVVELYPGGWQLLNNPPVLFNRNKNMKGQYLSKVEGDVHLIDKHFRFGNIDNLFLFKVYLVHCLIPNIPHLIAIFHGEKGSSKTTSVRKTRKIIDPSSRDLLTMPKGKNELALILANNYMPAFDNLEKIQSHQSELLCIASTGGGLSKRTLYTDEDETILDFKRCVVLNGINIVATKPDLLDRSILLELERIPPKERMEEARIWEEFDRDLPVIFSGILDTIGRAMEIYPSLNIRELPRMADACKWGYAISEAMGESGERFLEVYKKNQMETNRETIADHPVAAAMVALFKTHKNYESSVSELLTNLEKIAMKEKINMASFLWPKASNILSRRLKEVKSNLSEVGIEFSFANTKNSTRIKIYGRLKNGDEKKVTI